MDSEKENNNFNGGKKRVRRMRRARVVRKEMTLPELSLDESIKKHQTAEKP